MSAHRADDLAALARHARFSRWDGSQQAPELGADEIMDAISADMMSEGDLSEALRRLMERGWRSGDPTRPDLPGLQDLMDRLARQREEARERFQLGDVLGDIRRELDEIVEQERAGVQRRLDQSSGKPDGTDADSATDAGSATDPDAGTHDSAAAALHRPDAPGAASGRVRTASGRPRVPPGRRRRADPRPARIRLPRARCAPPLRRRSSNDWASRSWTSSSRA
ncbi:MAG: hypothetical protein WKF78_13265 [Candidatus Limnocylindrales bacterium]